MSPGPTQTCCEALAEGPSRPKLTSSFVKPQLDPLTASFTLIQTRIY